ncbi:hypothetical protein COW36_07915 [bacterium (Candidatus Blackallbacteria) CG17_big_fil_post_rev_8_21_14_2_50_48_46]|uniref:Peptidase MA-like domain-containing protein n=1 Tax=bacterium (Candidatus Blackallbacteria) CG17_big_fil_post_rev_8_21_14_2_50_48_46 TaxID=2014261 RepID=A0A2M7G6J1_9BACT|nr:MAG: hypothetical protein COW64_23100 [bacterium (Candidatus Blackallbacteria) CG18_big_fil_WC_8_21_14_2_50_49_26]PIW17660.1 MAG: hypothetical protein COW36_07915 [bacterium (Candidatus Blackallbacteria) CG17_big_fil_post_rev_8_21_14_2_50_48_46]PIW50121.1 MAG: hypothetical protein COW20_03695 [bacterium (Candidatus Blackallbacteria) CG13_big_fil_rev_8_21_14_2_50_49_14]
MNHRLVLTLIVTLALNPMISQANATVPITEAVMAEGECSQGIELLDAQLILDVDPDKGRLKGRYTAVLKNPFAKPLAQACFVLNPGLKIDRIEIKGLKSLLKEPTQGASPLAYRLIPQQPFASDSSQQLSLQFSGPIIAQPKFGRILPDDVFLSSQSFFYPRFDRAQNRYCPLNLQIKVPQGYLPVPSGAKQFPVLSGDTYHASIETACGFRNEQGFDLASARYAVNETGPLRIYHRLGKQVSKAELVTMSAEFKDMFKALGDQFGPHTATHFNLVETNREDLGGMGKVNTVFLSDKYFGQAEKVAPAQYSFFKQQFGDPDRITKEFAFYRRTVLAHECAHLFINHFYDYDKPWFAEGLPEFTSLEALLATGHKSDVERKLAEYHQIWRQVPTRPLPAINQASLDSQLGYRVNYYGTPLALWVLRQNRRDTFNALWKAWLSDRNKALTYAYFKASFNLSPTESAYFEKAFEPKAF